MPTIKAASICVALAVSACGACREPADDKLVGIPSGQCDGLLELADFARHCELTPPLWHREIGDIQRLEVELREREGTCSFPLLAVSAETGRYSSLGGFTFYRWNSPEGAHQGAEFANAKTPVELKGVGDEARYEDQENGMIWARRDEFTVLADIYTDVTYCDDADRNALANLGLERLVERKKAASRAARGEN